MTIIATNTYELPKSNLNIYYIIYIYIEIYISQCGLVV